MVVLASALGQVLVLTLGALLLVWGLMFVGLVLKYRRRSGVATGIVHASALLISAVFAFLGAAFHDAWPYLLLAIGLILGGDWAMRYGLSRRLN